MSADIDKRIVEMQFDNQQFERGIKETTKSLENLKKGLNLKESAANLANLSAEGKKFSLANIQSSVETIAGKFTTLGIVGVTALQNITNSALNAGKRITSALTIDPVSAGFQEYETKMNSIQTIMSNTASKGTTMADVTRIIDELNTYADKTIYNFAEMTRNIGTFTAAGVGLEESAKAIQGIANLAAASGSNSQQASTAMYQLSQALAAGTVKLMDWNSVVNAGMGGEKFQEALKATARDHGIAVDQMIEKNGSFRESLQDGWLSADVLNETLNKFTVDGATNYAESMVEVGKWTQEQADALINEAQAMEDAATKVKTFTQLWGTLKEAAQSGWGKTWEIIIGDFDEAQDLLTGISNALGGFINKMSDSRNQLLTSALSSGWKQLISNGIADAESFKDVVKQVGKEYGNDVDQLIKDTGSFEKSLKKGWATSDVLTESISRFTRELSGLSEEELKAHGYTKEQVVQMEALNTSVQNGSISMGEFAQKMQNLSGREHLMNAFKNVFDGLLSVLKPIGVAFREVFEPITSSGLYEHILQFEKLTEKFKVSDETAANIKNTFQGLFSILNIVKNAIISLVSSAGRIVGAFAPAGKGLLTFTSSIGNLLTKLDEAIDKTGLFKTIFGGLANVITFAANGISKSINWISEGFSSLTDGIDFTWLSAVAKIAETISNAFKKMGVIVKNAMTNLGFDNVLDVVNGGLLAAILFGVKKFIGNLTKVVESGSLLGSLKDLLDGVKGCLEAWQNNLKANTLLKIGGAITLLSASLLVLSTIDPVKLTSALGAITGLFIELFASMSIFDKIANNGFDSIGRVTRAMISLSAAVLVLSFAMKNLAALSWGEIAKGLTSVGVLMAELVAVSLILDKNSSKMVKGSTGLILFSASLVVLTQAVKQLAVLSLEELTKGLIGVGVLLTELSLFLNMTDFSGMGMLKGAGILLLATSLKVLSDAVNVFGTMDLAALAKGLGAVAVILAEIDIFINTTGNASKTISTAAAMTIMAGALVVMSKAVSMFSDMSLEEIGRGLAAMAGALAAIVLAMRTLPKNMMAQSVSLVGVASALVILSNALDTMGGMSWEEIAKGLLTLAGALTVIVVAMKLMTGALPGAAALLVISASLLALTPVLIALGGMSWESIAKGLTTLAGVFLIFGVASMALSPVIPVMIGLAGAIALLGAGVLAAGAGVLAFGTGLTALAAAFAASGGAIYSVVENLLNTIPLLFQKIGEGIIELANVIANGGPAILSAFVTLLSCAVDAIVQVTPKIVEGIFVLLDTVLASLVEYVPKFVDYLFQLFIEVINVLAERMPELIAAGANLLMAFVNGVLEALGQIDGESLQGLIAAIGSLIVIFTLIGTLAAVMTVAAVAITAMAGVLAILGGLAQIPGLTWLVNEGAAFLGAIGTAIGSFVGGLVGGFAEIASGALPMIGENLSAFMNAAKPFFDGVNGIDESASKGVAALAGAILTLTASNILEGITSWLTGGSSLVTFGQELAAFAPYFKQYADNVQGIDGEVVQASANAALALAEMAKKLPNSGGVAGWFAGENSLSVFAQELAEFGPILMQYANSVTGLDSGVVTNSANAAMAIAELATKLPNQGGVVGWFAGENSLSVFAEELAIFGPKLKSYADSVSGMDGEVVVNSANAAMSIAELANNLPNQGGVASWFSGDNTLSVFAEELAAFGPKLKAYADSVSGMDGNVVVNSANAAMALSELANNLPNQGGLASWFTGDNDLGTFGENIAAFGQMLKVYYDTVSGINTGQLSGVINTVWGLVNLANGMQGVNFSGMATFGASLTQLGNTGVDGFIAAFNNAIPKMRQAGVAIVTNVQSGAKSKIPAFNTAGRDAAQGFINGIDSRLSSATAAGRRLGTAALEAAKKALDSHSPSKEFMYLGQAIGDGLAIGIDNSIGNPVNAASDMIDEIIFMSQKDIEEFEDWLEDRKYYNEISLTEELMAWEKVQDRYLEGTEERKKADKEVYRLQNELVKATYQYSTDWIDEQKYYNKMSLEEELAAWQRIQSRYLWGSEERKQADKEVYRLKNELIDDSYQRSLAWIETEKEAGRLSLEDEIAAYERIKARYAETDEEYTESVKAQTQARIDAKKAEYDHSMDWIEEQKYYNKMSLADELAAYTRVQKRYEKGTEERKDLDREVYRLQQEINDARKKYYDDVAKVQEDSNQKRLELEQEYADKTKEINDKLAEDIKQLDDEYANALESRTQSLYKAYGLFDEVEKKEEVNGATLMQNLRDQIDEFSDWKSQLDSLSARGLNSELIEELQEMGPSAIAEIKALNSMSDSQLAQYATLWSEKHKQAKEQATKELEGLRIETQSKIADLRVQSSEELDEYRRMWNQQMEDLNAETNRQLEELSREFTEQVGILKKNTEMEFGTMTANVKTIMQTAGWNEAGQQIVDGISSGVQERRASFITSISDLGTEAVNALKAVLGIHSPSRVFAEIGRRMDEGMIIGLNRYRNNVENASYNVGQSAVSSIGNAIGSITDFINGNVDTSPTIRPVLDFTDLIKGFRYIDSSIAANRSMNLGMYASYENQNGGNSIEAFASKLADIGTKSNDKIIEAIEGLKSDFAGLVDKVTRLQVVMDTGSLVGAITPEMDRSLGNETIMNRRGVR